MKTTSFVALAIAGIMATGAAQARELRLAPAAPPAHPANYMYEHFAENLKEISGGAITGTIMGPEVVSLPQMKDALQTGLAEVGNTLPLYFPADMEVTGIAGDLALAGRNPHAMAMAMTEFGMTCEPCQAEFKKLGMVFLGAGSSNVYNLITTKPVRTAEDLKGLRLRTGGAPYSRWAENFGATPVNMGVGDQFEAISQGTIDGTMASKVDLLSYRLIDIAKYVTLIPIGTYHVTSNFTVGLSTWQGMSPEEREQVGMAAARANFDLIAAYYAGLGIDPEALSLFGKRRQGETTESFVARGNARAAGTGDEVNNTSTMLGTVQLQSSEQEKVRRIFDDRFMLADERWLSQLTDVPGDYLKARIAHERKRREKLGLAPPEPEDPQ